MPAYETVLAWVEPHGDDGVVVSFVAATTAASRAPATHHFASPVEAKAWVEHEASELGVRVEWVDQPGP